MRAFTFSAAAFALCKFGTNYAFALDYDELCECSSWAPQMMRAQRIEGESLAAELHRAENTFGRHHCCWEFALKAVCRAVRSRAPAADTDSRWPSGRF